jgi:hypothetical protein
MFRPDGTIAHLHVGYDESALDGILGEINALVAQAAAASAQASAAH